jgi:hypothetical protein
LKFIEKTINKYMWTSRSNRSTISIILNQTIKSIAKKKLNVMNLKIMKQTLSLYWIFKLKEIVSKVKQSIWVQIIKDIISHDYSKNTKQKLIESWKQMWSVQSYQLSSSVNHFWFYWVLTHRDNQFSLIKKIQLNNILFWYHS